MRERGFLLFAAAFFSLCLLTAGGCAETKIKTYTVEKERVDQNLMTGNRGYLSGQPQKVEGDENRRLTRTTYVAEVDLGSPKTAAKKQKAAKEEVVEVVEESIEQVPAEEAPSVMEKEVVAEDIMTSEKVQKPQEAFDTYTVKANDTLQKISQVVYGTTKKWQKIYEANKDRLKSPDRIYGGQVLKIPKE